LKQLGETALLSTTACFLGNAVYEQGRFDEAFDLTEEGERLGSPDDVMTQSELRGVRPKVLARRGLFEEAERLAREAVTLVKRTDYIAETAGIVLSYGEVEELAGKAHEADAAHSEALALYEQKGNVVRVAAVRERLERLRDVEGE
jgi:tetratricopeptide (TPR) repeat protein